MLTLKKVTNQLAVRIYHLFTPEGQIIRNAPLTAEQAEQLNSFLRNSDTGYRWEL